jgi:hypothetical protein
MPGQSLALRRKHGNRHQDYLTLMALYPRGCDLNNEIFDPRYKHLE